MRNDVLLAPQQGQSDMTGIGEISRFTDLIERRLGDGLPGEQAVGLQQFYEALPDADKLGFASALIQHLVLERHLRKQARRSRPFLRGGA